MEENLLSRGFKLVPRYVWKLPYRLWTLYCLLIYLAAYKPRYDPRLGRWLDAGQIVTTWGALAARLDRTKRQVQTDMRNLLKMNAPVEVEGGCRHVVITLRDYRVYQETGAYGSRKGRHDVSEVSPKGRHDVSINTTEHRTNNETGRHDVSEVLPKGRHDVLSSTTGVQDARAREGRQEKEASSTDDALSPEALIEETFRARIATVDRWTRSDAKRVKALLEGDEETPAIGADVICAAICLATIRSYSRANGEKEHGESLREYYKRKPSRRIGSIAYVETALEEAKELLDSGSLEEFTSYCHYCRVSMETMEASDG